MWNQVESVCKRKDQNTVNKSRVTHIPRCFLCTKFFSREVSRCLLFFTEFLDIVFYTCICLRWQNLNRFCIFIAFDLSWNYSVFCQRSTLENRPMQHWMRVPEHVGLWKTALKCSRVFLPSTDLKKLECVVAKFRWDPFNQVRLSPVASSSLYKSSLKDWKGSEEQLIFQGTSFSSSSSAAVHVHVHVVVVVIVVVIVIVVVVVADIDVADVGEASTKEGKKEGLVHPCVI